MGSASDTIIDLRADELTFAAEAWIGKVFDERYRLTEVLGQGGFAVVFRAKHLTLGRDVAVKILHPETEELDASLLARFQREADLLARLTHPSIVSATDYGVHEKTPYLVMELIEGRTLREVMDEGPITTERVLSITRQMLRALAYAHGKDVLHRDLKPGNVVLFWPDAAPGEEPEPVPKVLDFGLAKLARKDAKSATASITAEGVAFGTAGYISPEVLAGRPADARSDLYAVGVMLFEMLAGERPFASESKGEELRKTVAGTLPSLAERRPDLACAGELDAVLQLALARKREERFADANAMLAALEQIDPYAAPRPTAQKIPTPAPEAPKTWRDTKVALPIVIVLVAVPTALVLLLAFVLLLVIAID
jgi:serine/threonine protein kinase